MQISIITATVVSIAFWKCLKSAIVRWLKANFFMDVDVRDKSTIFGPDDDYDVYFKFWIGTTSGDLNMAAV